MRLLVCLLFLVSTVGSAQAQQAPCTVVGNVVKLLMPYVPQPLPPGGKYYPGPLLVPERRLPPQAFIAQDGLFHHVPILSVEPDEGPRRIVLVEAAFGEEWFRMAGRVQGPPPALTAVLSAARPQDSFALLAVGGPRLEVRFGSGRDELRAGIEALSHPDPHGPKGPDLLDGLLEATTWFGSPQTGDSIFQLGGVPRSRWDKAKASQIRSALVSRGVRLFTLGGAYENFGGAPAVSGVQDSPLLTLCLESGGGWQTIGYLGPNARDEMLREWQNAAKTLYEMATFAYVLHLPRTGPHVTIHLTAATLNLPGWPRLCYPSPLPVCPPPVVVGTPAAGQKKR